MTEQCCPHITILSTPLTDSSGIVPAMVAAALSAASHCAALVFTENPKASIPEVLALLARHRRCDLFTIATEPKDSAEVMAGSDQSGMPKNPYKGIFDRMNVVFASPSYDVVLLIGLCNTVNSLYVDIDAVSRLLRATNKTLLITGANAPYEFTDQFPGRTYRVELRKTSEQIGQRS